jgi:hypothetical protein
VKRREEKRGEEEKTREKKTGQERRGEEKPIVAHKGDEGSVWGGMEGKPSIEGRKQRSFQPISFHFTSFD